MVRRREAGGWLEPYDDDLYAALDSGLAGSAETTLLLGEADIGCAEFRGGTPRPVSVPGSSSRRAEAAAGNIGSALANLKDALALTEDVAEATESVRAEVWLTSVRVGACGRPALTGLEAATRNARKGGGPGGQQGPAGAPGSSCSRLRPSPWPCSSWPALPRDIPVFRVTMWLLALAALLEAVRAMLKENLGCAR